MRELAAGPSMAAAVEADVDTAQPGCAGRNGRVVRTYRPSLSDTPRRDRPRLAWTVDEATPHSGTIGKWVRTRREETVVRRA
jgi:hypothetical protein